ncbi:MAG: hypothetical protein FWE07_02770 [Turicibacter sp.]|nr:hypothetical protein [Turicibacter sp.]
MTYEKFEHKIMGMLLTSDDPRLETLFDQYLDAEVTSREESEMGFTVNFFAPRLLAIKESEGRVFGVEVITRQNETINLELVIKDGLIERLKGTCTTEISYASLIQKFQDLAFNYKNGEESEFNFDSENYPPDEGTLVKNISASTKDASLQPAKGIIQPIIEAVKTKKPVITEDISTSQTFHPVTEQDVPVPPSLSVKFEDEAPEPATMPEVSQPEMAEPIWMPGMDLQPMSKTSQPASEISAPPTALNEEIKMADPLEEPEIFDMIKSLADQIEAQKTVELPAVPEAPVAPPIIEPIDHQEKEEQLDAPFIMDGKSPQGPTSFTDTSKADVAADNFLVKDIREEMSFLDERVTEKITEENTENADASFLAENLKESIESESLKIPTDAITVEYMEKRSSYIKTEMIILVFVTVISVILLLVLFSLL